MYRKCKTRVKVRDENTEKNTENDIWTKQFFYHFHSEVLARLFFFAKWQPWNMILLNNVCFLDCFLFQIQILQNWKNLFFLLSVVQTKKSVTSCIDEWPHFVAEAIKGSRPLFRPVIFMLFNFYIWLKVNLYFVYWISRTNQSFTLLC